MPKVSIAIPVHEMKNWEFFFKRLLDSIHSQTFKNFEVVISDDAQSEDIRRVVHEHPVVPIKYVRRTNREPGMARNTNEAIKNCSGKYIKILYLDDYLAYPSSLEKIVDIFDLRHINYNVPKVEWLITATDDNEKPHWTDDIETGNNKLGSPSALTFRNHLEENLLFDENLSWLLDVVYYKGMYEKYGLPLIWSTIATKIGKGDHQMTHILTSQEKIKEHEYVKSLYEKN